MPNERLRSTLAESEYDEESLAREIGLDPKSVQRWVTKEVTPRRNAPHAFLACQRRGFGPIWSPTVNPLHKLRSYAFIRIGPKCQSTSGWICWFPRSLVSGCMRTPASS